METKCVIFDFGNVIAFFDHRKACHQLALLSQSKLTADNIYDDLFQQGGLEEQYDRGLITTNKFLSEIKRKYKISAGVGDVSRAWNDIFLPNVPMIELIQRLKENSYYLILASNTNELHYQWFCEQFQDVLENFNEEVISFKVGYRKPDKNFFVQCIEKSRYPVSQCVFIDDRREFVDVARAMGLKSIWYTAIENFPFQLELLGIRDKILLDNYSRPSIRPRIDFIDNEREINLTIYREKYSNFRHFDTLRWQTPSLVFIVAGAVIGFAPKLANGYPAPWILILYGIFVILCAWLMSRISFNLNLNTEALHSVAVNLGDYSIPKSPGRRGAAYWIEKFFWILGLVSLGAGIYFEISFI